MYTNALNRLKCIAWNNHGVNELVATKLIQLIFILLHTTALLRVFNLTKVYCPEIVSPLMMLLLLNVITLGQIGAGRGRYSFQEKVCLEIFLDLLVYCKFKPNCSPPRKCPRGKKTKEKRFNARGSQGCGSGLKLTGSSHWENYGPKSWHQE